MKYIPALIINLFSAVLFWSCSPAWNYTSPQSVTLTNGIVVHARASAYPERSVIKVEMDIDNRSGAGILLVPGIATIITPEGLRAPSITFDGPDMLLPGNKGKISMEFKPVNSRWINYHTGWEGDMERQYSVTLDFMQNSAQETLATNIIALEMPVAQYQTFLNKLAKEPDMAVFQISQSESNLYAIVEKYYRENIPTADEMQHKHEGEMETPQNSGHVIIIQGKEFFLDGALFHIALFRWKKQASVNIRIANRKNDEMDIDLSQLVLTAGSKKFYLKSIQTPLQDKGPRYILKPNDRMEATLTYNLDKEYQELGLEVKGLQMKGKELLPVSLHFTNIAKGLVAE